MRSPLRAFIANPAHHGLERTVAVDAINAVTGDDLFRRVRRWQDRLADIDEAAVLIHQTRGEELLAALLASWRLDKIPVLPATSPNAVLRALNLPDVDAVAGELIQGVSTDHLPDATNSRPNLILFTSGSSGAPTAVTKTLDQLESELELLDRVWGERAGESVFVSSVSRQHMFGLPFALLWPLVRGNPFYTDTVARVELLETLARHYGTLTLVTSPRQLEHLPHNLDWPLLSSQLATIFCAGAPLAMATAQLCRDRLIPITEVYGSTETGAVASREQTTDVLWRCLPGIEVAVAAGTAIAIGETDEGSALQIKSPCIDPGGNDWLAVADLGRLHPDGRFELLGRVDRIAKVAGKRISLTEVENALLCHPWVTMTKVLPLEERKGRLGAVVVLSSAGRANLVDQGRTAINQLFSRYLNPRLESVAVPRYWRYPGHLPVDAQGKLATGQLEELFFPERQPRLPVVLNTRFDAGLGSAHLELQIPETLFYFSGHFPGNPVLPGVVQVNWVLHHALDLFDDIGIFQRIENLKFQQIIQPGDLVNLDMDWNASRSFLTFAFSSSGHKHSSGRVVFTRND